MRTLTFNRVHKNGWLSFKMTGVPGAVYVDKRMLSAESLATPPQSIDVEIAGLVEPGADAVSKNAEKLAKQQEREAAKAEKAKAAAEKATARLQKLQDQAAKAAERAAAAAAKSGAPAATDQPTA